jgi:hypothetical protein
VFAFFYPQMSQISADYFWGRLLGFGGPVYPRMAQINADYFWWKLLGVAVLVCLPFFSREDAKVFYPQMSQAFIPVDKMSATC